SESSPYLLQHAHNPVDWYPWGEEALSKAKLEDKPILISIGYSACHWCHVMERESFEDISVAAVMNEHFVNIKIDREERPDLDHIYMDSVQAMTGSGGWPLNVFLTPDAKPFYGGTYFPPKPLYNRASWRDVLLAINKRFRENRKEVETQSENLTAYLSSANQFGQDPKQAGNSVEIPFSINKLAKITANILQTADLEEGGFGKAPKFPQTLVIQFLLRDYYYSGRGESLKQACLSLDKMICGGIYDQIGGGFARYSTDREWLVPHFEKMLYDNALMVILMSEAYQLTGKEIYKRAIIQTLDFIKRELSAQSGGFFSALDADSEDEEGKFYVWDKLEIESVLGEDARLFCEFYQVTDEGNWEGKNILSLHDDLENFAKKKHLSPEDWKSNVDACLQKLLDHRSRRVRPLLDDKILLGWNALMISAFCKAYAALGIDEYRDLAVKNLAFLWKNLKGKSIHLFQHSYQQGKSRFPGFLDDYAYLISSLIHLQEITGNPEYLVRARDLTEWTIRHFMEEGHGFFFYTQQGQEDVIIRKIEMIDGAIPSGNAVMASNLLYLSVVFDRPEWKEMAVANCQNLEAAITQYPGSFGFWATQFQALTYGMDEIVIYGKGFEDVLKKLLQNFIPFRILQSGTSQNNTFPLLKGKPSLDRVQIFLCRDYSCQSPVAEVDELIPLLENVHKYKN
ncbi:MAG: thioredoxin domain-containing protein, partial [Chitinophagales bacterium]